MLKCEQMKLGEADASGRRSPVGTGEFFTVPCDLVISAVGEQVDDALMSANGIELDKKGRPAFKTNVAGVYAASDATRGPATVVEGIADAARFAEEVIGAAHTYEIPAAAYVTKADAIAKKGTLSSSKDACCEGKRCLQCHTVCENCVDSCPNRANVAIAMADGSHQIVHGQDVQRVRQLHPVLPPSLRALPRQVHPVPDRGGYGGLKNAGVLFLGGDMVRVRTFGEPKDYDLSKSNDLPADLEKLIVTSVTSTATCSVSSLPSPQRGGYDRGGFDFDCLHRGVHALQRAQNPPDGVRRPARAAVYLLLMGIQVYLSEPLPSGTGRACKRRRCLRG